jgi:hypothetical protein
MAIHTVIKMHQCEECATVTSDPPNSYGNYYCGNHKLATLLDFPVTESFDLIETAA